MSEQSFVDFLNVFQDLHQNQQSFVVVTLTKVLGGAPQNIGSRMIAGPDGLIWGTIGGGKIEKFLLEKSKEILSTPYNSNLLSTDLTDSKIKSTVDNSVLSLEINLQKDIGMTCGGQVQVLLERFGPNMQWNIAIFGAGHVAQALHKVIRDFNAHIFAIEFRKEWLDKIENSPRLKKILVNHTNPPDMSEALSALPPQSFVVLLTMGHGTDFPILKSALENYHFPYVGVMGSAIKSKKIQAELSSLGLTPDLLAQRQKHYFCPIGEDLGNNSPAEIAVSIAAQLLKQREMILAR